MKGRITEFSAEDSRGNILGEDSNCYVFTIEHWRCRPALPINGEQVDFYPEQSLEARCVVGLKLDEFLALGESDEHGPKTCHIRHLQRVEGFSRILMLSQRCVDPSKVAAFLIRTCITHSKKDPVCLALRMELLEDAEEIVAEEEALGRRPGLRLLEAELTSNLTPNLDSRVQYVGWGVRERAGRSPDDFDAEDWERDFERIRRSLHEPGTF